MSCSMGFVIQVTVFDLNILRLEINSSLWQVLKFLRCVDGELVCQLVLVGYLR